MRSNEYNYLLVRRDYPMERGYRTEPEELPSWIHIKVSEENSSKWLTVHSRIHVNKEVRVGPTYSTDFTDMDIIRDLSGKISERFLK